VSVLCGKLMAVTNPAASSTPMTALISWAHTDPGWGDAEAEARKQQVLRLAQGLRSNGIDADLDLYHATESVDWTRWGPGRVRDVDVVLIVVSQAWKDAWEGRGDPGRNIGAAAEAEVLRSIYAGDRTALISKCRLIVLPASSDMVPDGMDGIPRHRVDRFDADGLEALLRDLTDQPVDVMPPLGQVPVLPPALTSLTPQVAEVAATPGDAAPGRDARRPERGRDVQHSREEEISQLLEQVRALPDPLPGEDVHLPWYRARELAMRRLAELGAFDELGGDGQGATGVAPEPTAPPSGSAQVDWRPVSDTVEVLWREQWQQVGGYEPASVYVHVVPVPAARLSERLFADRADRAPDVVRASPEVAATDEIRVQQQADAVTLLVERVEAWSRNRVSPGRLGGVRLSRSGQVSVGRTLPRDHMGAVLDAEDIRAALLTCLEVAVELLGGTEPATRAVIAAEVSDVSSVTDGRLAELGARSSASHPFFGRGDLSVGGDETVEVAALDHEASARAVADVLADLLERKYQHRR
jgi:hypothetical protein